MQPPLEIYNFTTSEGMWNVLWLLMSTGWTIRGFNAPSCPPLIEQAWHICVQKARKVCVECPKPAMVNIQRILAFSSTSHVKWRLFWLSQKFQIIRQRSKETADLWRTYGFPLLASAGAIHLLWQDNGSYNFWCLQKRNVWRSRRGNRRWCEGSRRLKRKPFNKKMSARSSSSMFDF